VELATTATACALTVPSAGASSLASGTAHAAGNLDDAGVELLHRHLGAPRHIDEDLALRTEQLQLVPQAFDDGRREITSLECELDGIFPVSH
jgi:hypothetical protein